MQARHVTCTVLVLLVHTLGTGVRCHFVSQGATLEVLEGSRNLRRSPTDTVLHQLQQCRSHGGDRDKADFILSVPVDDQMGGRPGRCLWAVIGAELLHRPLVDQVPGQWRQAGGLCHQVAIGVEARRGRFVRRHAERQGW